MIHFSNYESFILYFGTDLERSENIKAANEVVETKWRSGLYWEFHMFVVFNYTVKTKLLSLPSNSLQSQRFLQRKHPLMSNCKKLPQIQWVSIKHATKFDRKLSRKKYGNFTLHRLLCVVRKLGSLIKTRHSLPWSDITSLLLVIHKTFKCVQPTVCVSSNKSGTG